jgi:hypothetical protein
MPHQLPDRHLAKVSNNASNDAEPQSVLSNIANLIGYTVALRATAAGQRGATDRRGDFPSVCLRLCSRLNPVRDGQQRNR